MPSTYKNFKKIGSFDLWKAVHSIHGYLFSFTETTFINYHDPVTLETIGTFNMREAKTFPKDAFCQTQTAHGHYDDQGSFWNVMGCMRGSDSEDHPGPHVAYYPYKIPNAQARFQIDCIEYFVM